MGKIKKVKAWIVDKCSKTVEFCKNNPETVELIGAIGAVVGGGLNLASSMVKNRQWKSEKKWLETNDVHVEWHVEPKCLVRQEES